MKRLFAFGDSFSNYMWAMWPDLLSQSFDSTENYGYSGCDNFFIYFNVISFLNSVELNSDDIVIVQWTEPARLDYIENNFWKGSGIGSTQELVEKGLEKYVSDDISNFKSLFYMYNIAKMLNETPCKWIFLFLNKTSLVHKLKFQIDNFFLDEKIRNFQSYILNFQENLIDEKPLETFLKTSNSFITIKNRKDKWNDSHPFPVATLKYLESYVFPKFHNLRYILIRKFALDSEENLRKCLKNNVLNLTEYPVLKIKNIKQYKTFY